MCGIFLCHLNESVIDIDALDILFKSALERGSDGYGLVIIRDGSIVHSIKSRGTYYKDDIKVLTDIQVGDIIIGITRNAPETEVMSNQINVDDLQPLYVGNFVYAHNGSVTDIYVEEYKEYMQTQIDSEVIGLAYAKHGNDMVQALESISGGWSIVGYDIRRKQIIIATSFLPLYQCYMRGVGYFVHSLKEGLINLLKYRGFPSQYTRVWENFYCDELPPYTVMEIDVDSGLVTQRKYEFNFILPKRKKDNTNSITFFVMASGGIDSTTTMLALYEYRRRYNKNIQIVPVFIDYHQKSSLAEELSVQIISEKLELDYFPIKHPIHTTSMLTDTVIEVTTGTNQLKSTAAWVPSRNLMFLSYLSQIAEEWILDGLCNKAIILGGFPNISEESTYPDNSERAIDAFRNVLNFFTLHGHKNLIKIGNIMSGFTKKEELLLMKRWGFEDLFKYTVSCDHAIVRDGVIYQCSKNGRPACGSGLLSKWAAELAGIEDKRQYYEVDWEIEPIEAKWECQKIQPQITNPDKIERIVFDKINSLIS